MVWHKGLLFKLRQLGIVGTLYDRTEHLLTGRSQKVVINGISSSLRYPSGFNLRTATIFNLYQ